MPDFNASVQKAIETLGTAEALAKSLGVTPAAVGQWKNCKRQVPAERCPEIERATKGSVRCEDLRPDVAWSVLRGGAGESQIAGFGGGEGAHA